MEWLKNLINYLSDPKIYFTSIVISWWALMNYHRVWIQKRTIKIALFSSIAILGLALMDSNFAREATKPDNIPIWLMSYGVAFFFWLSISRGAKNDELAEQGLPGLEKQEADKKVYTWPDLVYSELICMVIFTAFLLTWAIIFPAPLEDPANTGITPAVAKAPWYFLGLQELLVYYDPWMAGVVLPTLIIVGLVSIPYFDINPKGNGYYTVKERFNAIWFFGFGFIVLWIALIFLGTFMRGPGWNFFGPFEYWDTHKVLALNNINLSEIIWIKFLNHGLPSSILTREVFGIVLILVYLGAVPAILAKTKLKDLYFKMGAMRYNLFMFLILVMSSLPIKMYLRWAFNLKYIVSIPEFLFNI